MTQAQFNGHEAAARLRRMFEVAITGWGAPAIPPADSEALAYRLEFWGGSAAYAARHFRSVP